MDYKIALAPDLGISAAQFAEAWNAAPESRDAAQVRLEPETGTQFFDPATDAAIAVLTGIVSSAIYDLIKAQVLALWAQRHPGTPPPHQDAINVIAIDPPDGTHLLVVTLEKE